MGRKGKIRDRTCLPAIYKGGKRMTNAAPPDIGMRKSKYRTEPELTKHMPRAIPFIVVNEFAERFSFYGMSAILVVFMTKYMVLANGSPDHLSRDEADMWFHNFTTFVYFTPIIGALIADIFWGKYNTILWVSLLYCAGHGTLALGETRLHLIIGLT